jgi:hypothetical protein
LKIGILPGDDIGLEVVPECIKVMRAAAACERLEIDWRPLPIGKRGHEEHGNTLPNVTEQSLRELDGWVMGPIGHAAYPRGDATWVMPPVRKKFDLFDALPEFIEDRETALEKCPTIKSRLDAFGRAVEQRYAEGVLQLRDGLGDYGPRDGELLCSLCHVSLFCHRQEYVQVARLEPPTNALRPLHGFSLVPKWLLKCRILELVAKHRPDQCWFSRRQNNTAGGPSCLAAGSFSLPPHTELWPWVSEGSEQLQARKLSARTYAYWWVFRQAVHWTWSRDCLPST